MIGGERFSPRGKFREVIARGEPGLDLAEAALAIAQEEYPLMRAEPYLDYLENMAARVRRRLVTREDPLVCLARLKQVLFEEEGFTGNQDEYYDPRNSFLNEALDRKRGNPIMLSLITMETARRAGLPVVGVGLPGHFIVRYLAPGRLYWFDPFYAGRLLSEDECEERLRRIYGGKMAFRKEFLDPVGGRAVLTRILYNLKNIYVEAKSHAKALSVVEKLILLNPEDWVEVRDRGILWYHLKQFPSALGDLERYLERVPESDDHREVARLAKIIRRLQKT